MDTATAALLESEGLQTVRVGSRVRVMDLDGEEEYEIVGREDADVVHGRISMESPLAQALLGRSPGEQV